MMSSIFDEPINIILNEITKSENEFLEYMLSMLRSIKEQFEKEELEKEEIEDLNFAIFRTWSDSENDWKGTDVERGMNKLIREIRKKYLDKQR